MSLVLDASVALAWCHEDAEAEPLEALLDRTTAAGAFAPALWSVEVLNSLLVGERRSRMDRRQRHAFVAFLRGLPVELDDEMADRAWRDTLDLAERHRLTI